MKERTSTWGVCTNDPKDQLRLLKQAAKELGCKVDDLVVTCSVPLDRRWETTDEN